MGHAVYISESNREQYNLYKDDPVLSRRQKGFDLLVERETLERNSRILKVVMIAVVAFGVAFFACSAVLASVAAKSLISGTFTFAVAVITHQRLRPVVFMAHRPE